MNVLLVDDHVIVRDALRRLLDAVGDCDVAEATEGAGAISLAERRRYDLIILDLNLPRLGGIELLRRLRLTGSHPILVFSMHAELIYVRRALKAGAEGYVSKRAAPDELLTAIRRVAGAGRYVERDLAQALALKTAQPCHALEKLSPREIEILRLLAAGRSLTEIGDALGLRYKTVANTCTIIKARLGVTMTADLVRLAMETGLA